MVLASSRTEISEALLFSGAGCVRCGPDDVMSIIDVERAKMTIARRRRAGRKVWWIADIDGSVYKVTGYFSSN